MEIRKPDYNRMSQNKSPKAIMQAQQAWLRKQIYLLFKLFKLKPRSIISYLKKHKVSFVVRRELAQNDMTHPLVLDFLSKDSNADIRLIVAQRKRTPESAFIRLSKDKNLNILLAVAGNENASPRVLRFLSRHINTAIRFSVAGNKNTPKRSLLELTRDPDKGVRETAKENLKRSTS